jgi:hypothetical protein
MNNTSFTSNRDNLFVNLGRGTLIGLVLALVLLVAGIGAYYISRTAPFDSNCPIKRCSVATDGQYIRQRGTSCDTCRFNNS